MPRQHRFDPPGGWHHVMHRGSRRQLTFLDDTDRRSFLSRLATTSARHNVEIHGFALMSNHYHLLVRCPDAGLSMAMRDLNSGYAQWFNVRHGLDGHLFRGRFRSLMILDDAYLVEVIRYIHRNPMAAGLCGWAADAPWTSHLHYLGCGKTGFLHTDAVLRYMNHERDRFDAFVNAPDTVAARAVLNALRTRRPALGGDNELLELSCSERSSPGTIASLRRLRAPTDIEVVEVQVAQALGTATADLHYVKGRRNDPLGVLLTVLADRGTSANFLAERYGFDSASTVASRIERVRCRAKVDKFLAHQLAELTRRAA